MQISIFPKAKAHPDKTKIAYSYYDKKRKCNVDVYEKQAASKIVNNSLPEIVDINNEDDLIDAVTKYAWSPATFDGEKIMENFIKTDFMVLDIDNGLTIEQAEEIVKENNLSALCLPSPSHTEENHKFRLVFPLSWSIFDKPTFDATWKKLEEIFPDTDPQCKDCSRFYFASTMTDGFWNEGELFEPEEVIVEVQRFTHSNTVPTEKFEDKDVLTYLYGEIPERIPEAISFFLENGHTGLPDGWIMPLNACCFTMALQGIPEEKIYSVIEKIAPEELDSRDIETIERAINDGYEERDEECS
jgi:hypothetical protein